LSDTPSSYPSNVYGQLVRYSNYEYLDEVNLINIVKCRNLGYVTYNEFQYLLNTFNQETPNHK
jgi:hypothetical protein